MLTECVWAPSFLLHGALTNRPPGGSALCPPVHLGTPSGLWGHRPRSVVLSVPAGPVLVLLPLGVNRCGVTSVLHGPRGAQEAQPHPGSACLRGPGRQTVPVKGWL